MDDELEVRKVRLWLGGQYVDALVYLNVRGLYLVEAYAPKGKSKFVWLEKLRFCAPSEVEAIQGVRRQVNEPPLATYFLNPRTFSITSLS